MPGVPIAMPSATVMVPKVSAFAPCASTPAAAHVASSSICMLQGVKLLQVDAIPTCGLSKSPSVNPTARSIARLGACLMPSTTRRENSRGSDLDFFAMVFLLSGGAVALHQVTIYPAHRLRFRADAAPGAIL